MLQIYVYLKRWTTAATIPRENVTTALVTGPGEAVCGRRSLDAAEERTMAISISIIGSRRSALWGGHVTESEIILIAGSACGPWLR